MARILLPHDQPVPMWSKKTMAVRMKERALSVVAGTATDRIVKPELQPRAEPRPESISDRVKRLQAEARGLAREHVAALQAAMAEVERLAGEVAGGGEAYPAGVREVARRLVEDCETKGQTMTMLIQRS